MSSSLSRLLSLLFAFAVAVFLFTGVVKLYAVLFAGGQLRYIDPVLGIPSGRLLAIVGLLEIALAGWLTASKNVTARLAVLIGTSGAFLLYRVLSGDFAVCACLGGIFRSYPWMSKNAGFLLGAVAFVLFLGSFLLLLVHPRVSVQRHSLLAIAAEARRSAGASR